MKLLKNAFVWARTKGLGWLRTEAVTEGISPKVLAGPIAAAITIGLNKIGVPVDSLAGTLGLSVTVVNGFIWTVAALVAGYLLGPGTVLVLSGPVKAAVRSSSAKYKLGRLPAFRPLALKDFATYASKLPSPPVMFKAPTGSYPIDGNATYGDCTIAGVAHLIVAWNRLFKQQDVVPSEEAIVAEYFKLAGGRDSGLVEANVLSTWHKIGLFGQRIVGYAPVKPTDIVGIRQAIAFYGGIYLGILCPESAQRQFGEGKPWTYEGEQTEEGHCIVGLGFTKDGLECATWGRIVLVTWEFLAHYLDEAWVILPHELVEAKKDTLGVDLATLQADLASV
jgi:hypothetical protein